MVAHAGHRADPPGTGTVAGAHTRLRARILDQFAGQVVLDARDTEERLSRQPVGRRAAGAHDPVLTGSLERAAVDVGPLDRAAPVFQLEAASLADDSPLQPTMEGAGR